MIIHWISTGFSVYILHPNRGQGYQWWSGPGGDLAYMAFLYTLLRKHNCYEHRCPLIGHLKGDDGHIRCKRHHRKLHPDYGQK